MLNELWVFVKYTYFQQVTTLANIVNITMYTFFFGEDDEMFNPVFYLPVPTYISGWRETFVRVRHVTQEHKSVNPEHSKHLNPVYLLDRPTH